MYAAGQRADDAPAVDLLADARHRLGAERRHGPVAAAFRHMVGEIAQQRRAMRRVHDFGMEHCAIETPLVVSDRGEGCALAHRDGAEAGWQHLDAVSMAHPDLLAAAFGPEPLEQRAAVDDIDEGAAELAVIGGLDAAAELCAHRLLAVADAEHRNTELEHALWRLGRSRLVHRGRAPRQDDRLGREVSE